MTIRYSGRGGGILGRSADEKDFYLMNIEVWWKIRLCNGRWNNEFNKIMKQSEWHEWHILKGWMKKIRNDSTTLVTNTHNHNILVLNMLLTKLTLVTCDQSK